MKKIIFIILDGLGDRPIPEFNGETPLEHAKTPNMDKLAKEGVTGIMHVLGKGVRPNSDEAHLTLFGYDKKEFPERGPIEAAGVGIKLEHGDVAFRANLATVDKELRVKDRRAGRIDDTKPFTKELDGVEIDGIRFIVKPGTGYRVSLVMRGKGLSDNVSNSDVHYLPGGKIVEDWQNHNVNTIKPLDNTKEAKHTADALQKFLEKAHSILEKNPLNDKKEKQGKLRGNYILTRYPGYYKKLKAFKEKWGLKAACIAGAGLYKGLGLISGMELVEAKGATGLPDTNVRAKFEAARKAVKNFDFIFVHVKPTDIFGENGDAEGKKEFIEKIDDALSVLIGFKGIIAITGDHSTPCANKDHSADPVPVLIHGANIKSGNIHKFGEKECRKGRLGEIFGKDYLRKIIELAEK